MLNQVVLVGRLVRDVKPNKGKTSMVATATLAIPRSYKNAEGTYDTDFIDCLIFDKVAENTATYCKKGDILGIKGRLESKVEEIETKKITMVDVIAEKVTFLSSKKPDE
jgi:single-strand DNA-binding protein